MKTVLKILLIAYGLYLCIVVQPKEAVPQVIPAPEIPIQNRSTAYQIKFYAEKYKVSPDVLTKVMHCESSGNQNAVGDGGRARGIFQYHAPTFETFAKELGENLDRENAHDQIKLTAWAFSKGYQSHWTCYTNLYAK